MSRFPFARYPNGWFQVAYSDEVAVGAVLPLKYFGRDLVLFRDNDGVASVLHAAALTYVAAALTSILTLLYFLMRLGALGGNRRDD